MTNKEQAIKFIHENQTKFCRTDREGAKYLVSKLVHSEMPPMAVWYEVLKIAEGL